MQTDQVDNVAPQTVVNDSIDGTTPEQEVVNPNDTVRYESYRKVVGAHKKTQTENETLRAKLAEIEQAKLQAEGKTTEALTKLRKEYDDLKKQADTDRNEYAYERVSSRVAVEAVKLGCKDTDKLMKLLDLTTLNVDENFKVNGQDVKVMLTEAKKNMPYFFGDNVPTVDTGTPNGKPINNKVDFSKMTAAELEAYAKQNFR